MRLLGAADGVGGFTRRTVGPALVNRPSDATGERGRRMARPGKGPVPEGDRRGFRRYDFGPGRTTKGAPEMDDGGAARDMKIAYTGMGLIIAALVIASILA